eukprot:Em0001g3274a
MSKAKRSDSLQKKHWSIKAHESLISRNAEGHFCLNVEGGAEAGLMPFVGEIRQDRINYQSGKVYAGEIIWRQYLATRFTKNSVDSELQHQIRENLHMRVVPCTTRSRQGNEQQGVDYNFISPEEFKRMEKNGDFLESGSFEGHFYGTPKPPTDPPSSSVFPTYARSPANAGYLPRDPVAAPAEVLPSVPRYRSGPASQAQPPIPRNLGPLPPTGRSPTQRTMRSILSKLPYGWEKPHQSRHPVRESSHRGQETLRWGTAPAASRRHPWCPAPSPSPALHAIGGGPEKQREAEAAAQWPEAGLASDYPDYPGNQGGYPGDMMEGGEGGEQDLEADLQGEVVKTTLLKTAAGFGFTIIGGDRPGELLQIKTIQKGSAADKDGRLQVGGRDRVHQRDIGPDLQPPQGGGPLQEHPHGLHCHPGGGPEPGNTFQHAVMDRLSINIVKGPLGFGFSLGESTRGPVVKQIMDHPRCAQLREGDIIMEVNGESVHNYLHSDLVSVLKRCPKGNQANFGVIRPAIEELPNYDPGDYLPGDQGVEPFTVLEVRLIRQVSGFGFRIIGGKEEGSQATIGAIVPGGAADLDGRLQIGDEITQINGRSVLDAAHQDVINYMGEAAAQGEVTLKISRKVPPLELNPHTSYMPAEDNEPLIPQGIRRVLITRPNTQTSFGFVLQSNTLRAGCIVCRLVQGSPADQSGQLYQFDELISVNGQDVSHMDHSDVVTLIKASGTTITLEVQQPQDLELVKQQQLMDNQPPSQQAVAVVMDNRGRSYSGNTNTLTSSGNYPGNAPSGGTMPGPTTFASQYSVSGGGAPGLQYTGPAGGTFPRNGGGNYPGSSGGGGGGGLENSYNGPDDDAGPQISANLDGFASDDEDILHIEIHRDGTGFGFSIRGGAEYNAPLCVLRMAPGGAAERDGRLRVGDELLEINGNSTEGLGHADAITIIKHGGDIVKLTVRRLPESLSGRYRSVQYLMVKTISDRTATIDVTQTDTVTMLNDTRLSERQRKGLKGTYELMLKTRPKR